LDTENINLPVNTVAEKKSHSLFAEVIIRLFREKHLAFICGIVVVLMLLVGIFANFIAPYGTNDINAKHVLEAPTIQFPLGTDNLGRDLLSRVIYGARISMIVGIVAPAIAIFIAILIGVPTGFMGGKLDIVVQRFVDAWMAFPSLIILLSVMSLVGPGLIQVVAVLGVTAGIRLSRTVRGAVIGIKENVYVGASKAIGASTSRTLLTHIIPNIMPILIILFTMDMASAILAEASLSFLGFGIPPPEPSWGGMLSGAGRRYMLSAPWMALWPGIALSIAVYCISMLGDGIRDIIDPKLKGGLGRYGGAIKTKSLKKLIRS
jgi:peptide/nickel transport system permease protein